MKKMTEQDGKSLDLVNENLEALKAILPEAFTENGVDFEVLRQLLGDSVDEGEEKYGLTWHGKKMARQIALTPSLGTLRPCPEESVDWDTTQNLFIEGENMEVLKLLQKSYANKVKMIYIDPPYNTGKEFIYPDKFQDNLDTYMRYTGQKGEDGFKVSSNTESSGRFHTNWLNMMYPRLKLARNLLRDDGVIFSSIDDNELSNLKKVCDEVFGEDNFVANIIWQKKFSRSNDATYFSTMHDNILCFSKFAFDSQVQKGWVLNLLPRNEEDNDGYSNPDGDARGPWTSVVLSAKSGTEKLKYKIITPSGRECWPPEGRFWSVNPDRLKELVEDNRIWFGKKGDGIPRLKTFLSEVQSGLRPNTIWFHSEVSHNQEARQSLKTLFGGNAYFDSPKPVELLKRILYISSSDNEGIYLDFFSGSCTTAHAVLDLNKKDGGNRKFIMVQLPEPCEEKSEAFKAGYKTIAEIGKERIRRAAAKIKEETPDYKGDLGFKVFKLDSSNIRAWNPDRNNLEQTLLEHVEHLVEGRSEEDVLYELLLKRGVELTVPIEERLIPTTEHTEDTEKEKNNSVYSASSVVKKVYSIGYGALFACLNESINLDEVEILALGIIDWHKELEPASDTQVVFRDSAFANDIAKTNMTAILEQNGIQHVRSL